MDRRDRQQIEYRAMRASIVQRGTARMVLVPVTFIAWAATAVAATATIGYAAATILPLLLLAAGFEAVFALHVNVERIGRYVQVFHEADSDGWEHVAMEFGRRFPGSGPDPLFSRLFAIAVSANYLPAALGGALPEMAVLAVLHLVVINRIRLARAFAARQRDADLARFREIAGRGGAATPLEEPAPLRD